MELSDWGDAPDQDYPSLLGPHDPPMSLNAQKKAKRKRKQQQDQLQSLLDEPVKLRVEHVPGLPSGESEVHLQCSPKLAASMRAAYTPLASRAQCM